MQVKPELVQRTLDIVMGNGDTTGFFEPIVFEPHGGEADGSIGEAANQACHETVAGKPKQRRRRGSLPEALIQPDALLAVVNAAGTVVEEDVEKDHEEVVAKPRQRRRRGSLPEVLIQPDALLAVKGDEEVVAKPRQRRRRGSLPEVLIQPDALLAAAAVVPEV